MSEELKAAYARLKEIVSEIGHLRAEVSDA